MKQLLSSLAALGTVLAITAFAAEDANTRQTQLEDLGRALFFDVNLSQQRTQNCATCHDPALAIVSRSIIPPPLADRSSIRSTSAASWTRSSCSRSAALASTTSSPIQSRSARDSSIATSRRALSGWPPVSCWKQLGWRT